MELQSRIGPHSDHARFLRHVEIIFWEELPMSNRAAVECTNALLQLLMGNTRPFGGKIIVGLGDFQQVAPVVRNGGPTASLDASVRSSPLWDNFQILRLHQPVRNAEDPAYSEWVDSIGEDFSTDSPIELPLIDRIHSYEQIADFLFPDSILHTPLDVSQHSFLSPLNTYVDEFNLEMLERIPFGTGKLQTMIKMKISKKTNLNIMNIEHKYFSYDSIKDSDEENNQIGGQETSSNSTLRGQISTTEFLHEIHEPGVPPHELYLKELAVCVLMRNLSLEEGLVKNARVVIKKLLENVIEVELVGAVAANRDRGKMYYLPRIMFEFQPRFCTWTMQRKQFPLRLAYATTFNSCQGLTLDRAVIDL